MTLFKTSNDSHENSDNHPMMFLVKVQRRLTLRDRRAILKAALISMFALSVPASYSTSYSKPVYFAAVEQQITPSEVSSQRVSLIELPAQTKANTNADLAQGQQRNAQLPEQITEVAASENSKELGILMESENPEEASSSGELEDDTALEDAVSAEGFESSRRLSGERENFVTAFENLVVTRIVPKVPGLALAIISDGQVKVLRGFGEKKAGSHDWVNTNTVFRLASVSKTIASTAAAVMVRDGKISWDTTISSLVPEVKFSNPRYGDKITVRDIMSQATGLPTHTNTHLIEDNVPYVDAVNSLRYVNFVCPPGKCYAYQNVTFSLIGNLIFNRTGTAYEKYVSEKLFKPLGMVSASFGLAGLRATNNFAQPHVMGRRRWLTTNIDENYYHIYPAAGANASIADMSQWVLAQMGHNPNILSTELLKQLHQKVTKNTPAQSHYGTSIGATDTYYGLGWRVFDYRGDKNFVHHGGWVKGFRSEMVFNQELQIGMVLLTNSETKLARNIIFKFLDAYANDKQGQKKLAQLKLIKPTSN